jgi:hypothetical protein
MAWPDRWLSLFGLLTLGSIAFRAIGMIIGAIANSTAEATALVQLLYLPMLLLSGATIPITVMPMYVQIVAQYLPATYLNTGMQQVLHADRLEQASAGSSFIADHRNRHGACDEAVSLGKGRRISARAKLWAVAVLRIPGAWHTGSVFPRPNPAEQGPG